MIYLVGDIVDGWRLRSSFYWPQQHNNVVRRFLTLIRRGSMLVYVAGNHDEFLRRYTDTELGNMSLVDQATHETADGKRLVVIHGDHVRYAGGRLPGHGGKCVHGDAEPVG